MFSASLYSFYEQFSPADAKLNNDNLLTLQGHSLKALETFYKPVFCLPDFDST